MFAVGKRYGFVLLLEAALLCVMLGVMAFALANAEVYFTSETINSRVSSDARSVGTVRAAAIEGATFNNLTDVVKNESITINGVVYNCSTALETERTDANGVRVQPILITVQNSGGATLFRREVLRAAANSTKSDALPTYAIAVWTKKESSIPAGWVVCDGSEYMVITSSRADYITTPDLRGRMIFVPGVSETEYKDANGNIKTAKYNFEKGKYGGKYKHFFSVKELAKHSTGQVLITNIFNNAPTTKDSEGHYVMDHTHALYENKNYIATMIAADPGGTIPRPPLIREKYDYYFDTSFTNAIPAGHENLPQSLALNYVMWLGGTNYKKMSY